MLEIINEKLEQNLPVNIELGCGTNKSSAYIGIDLHPLTNVDIVLDFEQGLELIQNSTVDSYKSRHVMEHIRNFELLQSEVYRTLKPGGIQEMIVPHFSSPYFYSDPTHVRTFGLYTMSYFSSNHLFRRKIPSFYFDFQFELISVNLGFRTSRYKLKNLLGKYLFEKIFNFTPLFQELYEVFLSKYFSCTEIKFVLRKPHNAPPLHTQE